MSKNLPSYNDVCGISTNPSFANGNNNQALNEGRQLSGVWNFLFYNKMITHTIEVFISRDSLDKYKAFKNNLNLLMQSNIQELQREGYAVPLLRASPCKIPLTNAFLTIYKYNPPSRRNFDPKVDRFEFCKVTSSFHKRYHQYNLSFNPDPKDRTIGFSCTMFRHHTLPIVDFVYNGRKYRWIYEKDLLDYYEYGLFELSSDQQSMTDGMNIRSQSLSSLNPILKGSLKNIVTMKYRFPKEEYYSNCKVGELKHLLSASMGSWVQTATFIAAKPPANYEHNSESIFSVDMQTLVFLSLSLVLKRHKDQEKQRRRANNN